MTPKKTAAPFLWFSFCFGNVLEAVVLGSVQYPDNGLHSHLDARGPAEASASSRNDFTSVHVPSYMISLYRTLSELDRRGSNGSQTRSRRYANTVTSFMDLGQGETDPPVRQTDKQMGCKMISSLRPSLQISYLQIEPDLIIYYTWHIKSSIVMNGIRSTLQ